MSDLTDQVTQMALQLDKFHGSLQEGQITKDQQDEAVTKIGKILDKLFVIQITEEILELSKVAFSLKKIKKYSNPSKLDTIEGIKKRCGNLMRKWRDEYNDSRKVSSSSATDNTKTKTTTMSAKRQLKIEEGTDELGADFEPLTKKVKLESTTTTTNSESTPAPPTSNSSSTINVSLKKHKFREKDRYKGLTNSWLVLDDQEYDDLSASSKGIPLQVRQKFYKIFMEGKEEHYPNVDEDDIARFVCHFERVLSRTYKGDAYKSKFRNFSFDIKKNIDLRRRCLEGDEEDRIRPEELVNFTTEQLQTKERQEVQAKIRQEELDKRDSSYQDKLALKNLKDSGVECRRCGSRKILTHQIQMRSGDEPPTTFYNCVNCKNQWKCGG